MAKLDRVRLGDCGEFYVASYLTGMGFTVTVSERNAPTTDLVVKSTKGGSSISMQVRTGGAYSNVIRKKNPGDDYWVWRAGKKALKQSKKTHWFAFVYIGDWPHGEDSPSPKVFFVPSKIVAKTLRDKEVTSNEWFWLPKDKADIYLGLRGFRNFKKAISK